MKNKHYIQHRIEGLNTRRITSTQSQKKMVRKNMLFSCFSSYTCCLLWGMNVCRLDWVKFLLVSIGHQQSIYFTGKSKQICPKNHGSKINWILPNRKNKYMRPRHYSIFILTYFCGFVCLEIYFRPMVFGQNRLYSTVEYFSGARL